MSLLALAALVLALFAVGAATAFLIARTLALFRQLRAFADALADAVGAVSLALAAAGSRAQLAAGRTGDFESSLARLAVSRARLAVVLSAWRDVRDAGRRASAAVPRK